MKINANFDKMGSWEIEKASFLILTAKRLGMDISGYGELNVNPNSGYTYLWLEDYCFTLYMPISCDLKESDIWVLWTNMEDGEEIEKTLDEFSDLREIETWCQELYNGIEEE